jgi:hypothetical protein
MLDAEQKNTAHSNEPFPDHVEQHIRIIKRFAACVDNRDGFIDANDVGAGTAEGIKSRRSAREERFQMFIDAATFARSEEPYAEEVNLHLQKLFAIFNTREKTPWAKTLLMKIHKVLKGERESVYKLLSNFVGDRLDAYKIMNNYFIIINDGRSSGINHIISKRELEHLTKEQFELNFRNKFFTEKDKEGKEMSINIGSAWLKSTVRNEHSLLVFDPSKPYGGQRHGVFNTYPDFATEAQQGDWSHIHDYLLNVVCSGDRVHYSWLMAWLAQMVQEPWRIMGTAIVLIAEKGAGKSILYNILKRMLDGEWDGRPKYVQLAKKFSNPKHFFSQFNDNIERTLLLNPNESFWAGNHEHESILKDLITEPEITTEIKRGEKKTVRNFNRLLITANPGWVVPTTPGDERRYFVPNMSGRRIGDRQYWDEFHASLDDELPAFLYELRQFDFRRYDLRYAPPTDALNHQIVQGLRGMKGYVFQLLDTLRLPYSTYSEGEYYIVIKRKLYNSCTGKVLSSRDYGALRSVTTGFWQEMKKIMPFGPDTKLGKEPCVKIPSARVWRDHWDNKYGKWAWENSDDDWIKDDPLTDDLLS